MNFRRYNLITGWVVFLISALVYLLTMEPTASLWDCGEFIAAAYKLQVGHPPGAPVFMILGRFFALFAPGPGQVAAMINAMSALSSAFTILFLFWSITHLARKTTGQTGEMSPARLVTILGSGVVGALAYTFSDTFWFSAVEGEVYAMSSLFTALVFWAILKWEECADSPFANRWILLIAYLMGLSIGVHLLNLLAIPAIALVYYFRKHQPTLKGILFTLVGSMFLLGFMMYGIIQGFALVASWFELMFVNGFGLPYKSGVLVYALLVVGFLVYGLHYSYTRKKVVLNTILLAFTMVIAGYSSYATIVIRSLANPPMDENNPETIFSLIAYLNREQYGDRPLVRGHYYNAPVIDSKEGKLTYTQVDSRYEITNRRTKYVYNPEFVTIFPRMYSPDPNHVKVYQEWGNIKGKPTRVTNSKGEVEMIQKPTFGENLVFFFRYQVGHMYLRYFMWNFSGRQNDNQGHGGILKGNWITGIDFLDSARLGDQKNLPPSMANHPARNKYYLLPLLLGLVGFLYQYKKNKGDFWVVTLLFVMTGLAIVVYLNQTPIQPRERDYAYAGSFYAFAIWIGLGVAGILDTFRKQGLAKSLAVSTLCLAAVPGIMAKENWDDHDRSGRYFTRDMAWNYLQTCEPNALIFTNGDNDTFPLWYIQDVEGTRTDVRVVNLMLLNTDWYIDQMRRQAYESAPVPFSLTPEKYIQGTRDVVYLTEQVNYAVTVKQAIDFIADDNPRTRLKPQPGVELDYLPTRDLILPVDTSRVIANGTVKPENRDLVSPSIEWKLSRRYLGKSEMMVLDLLAHNNWERPVYYVSTHHEGTLGLEDYLQLDGFAYRLVPIRTPVADHLNAGRIDVDILYKNMVNKFRWGRINEDDVYIDHFVSRTLSVLRVRNTFSRLAHQLIAMNRTDSALVVLDKAVDVLRKHPHDFFTMGLIEGYYKIESNEKGNNLVDDYAQTVVEDLGWYLGLKTSLLRNVDHEVRLGLQSLQRLVQLSEKYQQTAIVAKWKPLFDEYFQLYALRSGKTNP